MPCVYLQARLESLLRLRRSRSEGLSNALRPIDRQLRHIDGDASTNTEYKFEAPTKYREVL